MRKTPYEPIRTLDKAEGILIALRRCEPTAAFCELVDAAVRYNVTVSDLATALVTMAVDHGGPCAQRARDAAHAEWGGLLA
jgi:hypothetical protein